MENNPVHSIWFDSACMAVLGFHFYRILNCWLLSSGSASGKCLAVSIQPVVNVQSLHYNKFTLTDITNYKVVDVWENPFIVYQYLMTYMGFLKCLMNWLMAWFGMEVILSLTMGTDMYSTIPTPAPHHPHPPVGHHPDTETHSQGQPINTNT